MKKKISIALAVCCMLAAFSLPVSADQYGFDGAGHGEFGEPTSVEVVTYVAPQEETNVDRSKTSALIPPSFGSPTSYTLNAGEYLTPNLIQRTQQTVTYTGNSSGVTVLPPTSLSEMSTPVSVTNTGVAYSGYIGNAYTAHTDVSADLYYSGGELGTLSIPAINLTVKVYEGTDNTTLAKGAGHFTTTSIWDGNVAIAAHNRGVNNHFGKIHTLSLGDTVSFSTKLGTRTYEVYSVAKIAVDDGNPLCDTSDNIVTLVTCVMNEPSYRWCVQAREVA